MYFGVPIVFGTAEEAVLLFKDETEFTEAILELPEILEPELLVLPEPIIFFIIFGILSSLFVSVFVLTLLLLNSTSCFCLDFSFGERRLSSDVNLVLYL